MTITAMATMHDALTLMMLPMLTTMRMLTMLPMTMRMTTTNITVWLQDKSRTNHHGL